MYISFLILSSSSGLILKDDYEERTDSSLSFLQRYWNELLSEKYDPKSLFIVAAQS